MNVLESFTDLRAILLSDEKVDEVVLNSVLTNLYGQRNLEEYKVEMKKLRNEFPCISTDCTMQGRAYHKKYGYAGDFEIIDKIYTSYVSGNPKYQKWDEYFQSQLAPIAVRNRKRFFKEKLRTMHSDKQKYVLNLASGSCRDIFELFEENIRANYSFDCVELDKNAIEFAKSLLGSHTEKVNFINENIFRFTPNKEYDIIWSAGLFDYFDDSTFEKILSRLIKSNPKAKIIIGNFSNDNPTIPYMEIVGEWFLNHRSEKTLKQIAINAGAYEQAICVESEPQGVNLFLTIN